MKRFVRNLLRTFNLVADPPPREPGVVIHEDWVGMRNLHPLIAETEVTATMRAAVESEKRNRVIGGVGWSEVHVIEPPKVDFAEIDLTIAATVAALEESLPRVRRFHSGSLSSRGSDPFAFDEDDAHCYGFDANCFIKLETRGTNVVAIWFDLAPEAPADQRDALRAALVALDRRIPCVIADYWLNMTGRVGDVAFLDGYFAQI